VSWERRFSLSIIVNGAPKSATLFVSELLRLNLDREDLRIATRSVLKSRIMPSEYYDFIQSSHFVAQQHICPDDFNFSFLKTFPPTLFIHLVRDPKDVLVSWKHHITRSDLNPWEGNMYIFEKSIPSDFYSKSDEEMYSSLVEIYFPKLCIWMNEWIRQIESLGSQFYLIKSTPEILNSVGTWESLLHQHNLLGRKHFEMFDFKKSKHFRSGKEKQYHNHFTQEQITKMMEIQCCHKELSKFLTNHPDTP